MLDLQIILVCETAKKYFKRISKHGKNIKKNSKKKQREQSMMAKSAIAMFEAILGDGQLHVIGKYSCRLPIEI